MSRFYKVINASSEHDSHAFEEFESEINRAAEDGYKLKKGSIQIFREDRGDTQVPLCRIVAIMTKQAKKKKKSDIASDD